MRNIREVLHPEIVLDRRGSLTVRTTYKRAIENILFDHDRSSGSVRYYSRSVETIDKNNVNDIERSNAFNNFVIGDRAWSEHINLCQLFNSEVSKEVFYMRSNFARDLMRCEIQIPAAFLPERFLAFFALEPGTLFLSDGEEVTGAYVYIGSSGELPLNAAYNTHLVISAVYKLRHTDFPGIYRVSFPILADHTLEESVKRYAEFEISNVHDAEFKPLARLFLNAALFTLNEIENIIDLKPTHNKTGRKRREALAVNRQIQNDCTISVKLLSFSYHGPIYEHATGSVRAHLRWQPHGPGLSQRRWTLVRGHERTYRRSKDLLLGCSNMQPIEQESTQQ